MFPFTNQRNVIGGVRLLKIAEDNRQSSEHAVRLRIKSVRFNCVSTVIVLCRKPTDKFGE